MPKNRTQNRKAGRSARRRSASADSTKRLGMALLLIVGAAIAYLVATSRNVSSDSALKPGGNLLHVITNEQCEAQIVQYTAMTVSFNKSTHQPNWVAWELLGSETDGESGRKSKFTTDFNVPGCPYADDYRNSGYDRGHMAPAGDMKWNPQAMEESFLLTNISPQAPDLNRGAWKKLEEKCRQRAVADSALAIVCGPVFKPGEGVERIGKTGVAVPRKFFKVILAPYAEVPYAIGFIMPNGYVKGGMQATAVTVDEVEALTGHDFFSELPDDIEDKLEAQCDFNRFSRITKRR